MFDPHKINKRSSKYYSRKGQVIQQKVIQLEPFYSLEDAEKYLPIIIKNGLLDKYIYRLQLHSVRMMVFNGRYLETYNQIVFHNEPPFVHPNFK